MSDRNRLVGGVLVFSIAAALLIVPPLAHIFNRPVTHLGVPQVVIYLFAVWLLMIGGTALLTHFLPRQPAEDDGAEGQG